jgi:hypothetical protein
MLNKNNLILITLVLFITGCASQESLTPVKEEKKVETAKTEQVKTVAQEMVQDVVKESDTAPDISGNYALVKGAYIYNNGDLALQNSIEASSIVIEKLDENNFGYYYVAKVEGLKNTEGYFGGFTYKDGQFYQKVIDYPTTNTILYDNISLIPENDSLKLTVKTFNAKRVIHWNKVDDIKESSSAILIALEEEKKAYIELFKEKLFPNKHISMNLH